MIRLKKERKPEILVNKEDQWLKELQSYMNVEQNIPSHVQRRYGHEEIKKALVEETFQKCAYCESKITHVDYGDIEHIKPKSKFEKKTFEWSNLTLACRKCNQNKGAYYEENASILNPYIDDVEKEIVFLGTIPSARSERASLTVKLLKLDRIELLERRKATIDNVQPLIDNYLRASGELKQLLLEDLIAHSKKDKEFSSMMKRVIDSVEISAVNS